MEKTYMTTDPINELKEAMKTENHRLWKEAALFETSMEKVFEILNTLQSLANDHPGIRSVVREMEERLLLSVNGHTPPLLIDNETPGD